MSISSLFRFTFKCIRYLIHYIYDIFFITLWNIISNLSKLFIKFDKVPSSVQLETFSNIYFWRAQDYTNLLIPNRSSDFSHTYSGSNVNDLLSEYITENLGMHITEISHNQIMGKECFDKNSVIVTVISNNLRKLNFILYLFRLFICALRLRKLNIPVICFLPDSFFPDAAIISLLLSVLTRGNVIATQNTKIELTRFGYTRVGQPIIWTYPQTRIKKLTSSQFEVKMNTIVVAKNSSGGSRRESLITAVSRNFEAHDYQVIGTTGSLSQGEYEDLIKESGFIATTNYVQDGFFYGPRCYQKRISSETITGRTWDAFASRSLLITNPTEALSAFGFHPGSHFLDIRLFLNSKVFIVPTVDEILEITQRSFELFIALCKAQTS